MKYEKIINGHEFVANKCTDCWQIYWNHNGKWIRAAGGRLLKDAWKDLDRKKPDLEEAMQAFKQNQVKRRFFGDNRIKNLFARIFKVDLLRFEDRMLCALTGVRGLDVVAFDRWLGTPDGTSTYKHIQKNYGDKAVKLVKKLI